jgi:hypothetical protein
MAVGFQTGAPKEFNATGRKDILGAAHCSRCDGLMVPYQGLDFLARRCVQCGDVVDSVILQNRYAPSQPSHKVWGRGRVGTCERAQGSSAWSMIAAELMEGDDLPADGNARRSSLA